MDQIGTSSLEDFEKYLESCDDPSNAWDSKFARKALTDQSVLWILSLANWINTMTLTFRNDTPYDVAIAKFKRLVRYLNKDLFGKHYTKIVKHSYFSYVLGIEYQSRGVIHFHGLVDKPVNFKFIHTFWNDCAGYAYIKKIRSQFDCVKYIAKYNLKGGQNEVYIAEKEYIPKVVPYWWNDDKDYQLNLYKNCPGVLSGRETRRHTGRS